jgi:signal transduction histidine kinase
MALHDVLRERKTEIMNQFVSDLRTSEAAGETSGMTNSVLIDHLPRFLDEIVAALRRDTESAIAQFSASARKHGEQRFKVGFDLAALVHEYEVLRRSIVAILEQAESALVLHELEILARCFNVGMAEAVTEFTRHHDAELRAAIRGREEIIEIVSADLRSPLAEIEASAGALTSALAADRLDVVQMRARVKDIERTTARMNRLVDNLLELSRLEKGAVPLAERPESLAELLSAAIERHAPSAAEKSIVLLSELVNDGLVVCERAHVLTVLDNLLDNAIRFTPEGAAVSVRAGLEQDGGWFTVRDCGPGIAAERIPDLFERVFRAPGSLRHADNTGLGLAVAKELVELHGGRIWADSKPGEGATFQFTIPAR